MNCRAASRQAAEFGPCPVISLAVMRRAKEVGPIMQRLERDIARVIRAEFCIPPRLEQRFRRQGRAGA